MSEKRGQKPEVGEIKNLILEKGRHISYSSSATPSVIFDLKNGVDELAQALHDKFGGFGTRKAENEGLIIKKYIMTLPMDIRRSIMAYDADRIENQGDNNE